jgi:hypothetical protein
VMSCQEGGDADEELASCRKYREDILRTKKEKLRSEYIQKPIRRMLLWFVHFLV